MTAPKAFADWARGPKSIDRIPIYTEAWWDAIFTAAMKASGYVQVADNATHNHAEACDRIETLQSRCRELEAALEWARPALLKLPYQGERIAKIDALLVKEKP